MLSYSAKELKAYRGFISLSVSLHFDSWHKEKFYPIDSDYVRSNLRLLYGSTRIMAFCKGF